MPFTNWNSFVDLLGKLAAAEDQWGGATDFAQFDTLVRSNCTGLVDTYDKLCGELTASGDYGDRDQLFRHVRIVALARSAKDAGMGADWAGYWVSRDTGDRAVYAESCYAPFAAWAPVGEQETTGTDTTEQQVDKETGRWRRWDKADSEFEYYHDADAVWERRRDGEWHRFHADVKAWLRYDGPSKTWLYQGEWRAYDAVAGKTVAPADEFAWVPTDQAGRMQRAHGDGWRAWLGPVLVSRWGAEWAKHPVEHRQYWLTGLLDELLATQPAPTTGTAKAEPSQEIDLNALAEEMVAESIAEIEGAETLSSEERAAMVAAVRQNLAEAMAGSGDDRS